MKNRNEADRILVEARKSVLRSRRRVRKMEFEQKMQEKVMPILAQFPIYSTEEKQKIYDYLAESKNLLAEARGHLVTMELLYAMLLAG